MNKDIRLSVEFFDHPKTVKLQRRLGLEAVIALQRLWLWAAQNRPDGLLSNMDGEDIEIAAKWEGQAHILYNILISLKILTSDGGVCSLALDCGLARGTPILDQKRNVPQALRRAVFKRDAYTCQYCGEYTENPHCDHVIPHSRGGWTSLKNLATACRSCNTSKGARTPEEWLQ